eukprot:TRINITY_DN1795_c2_g2_i1.p1 TRINITY_DN1795_c2_g2~~TRINITY_DN1795_c2_g2_i1.p1  ORF type:complete len:1163 (+),score=307.90 TRINITY_DN1795_c2_g2_i1:217-3705(+)
MRPPLGMPVPFGHQAKQLYRRRDLLVGIEENKRGGLRLPGPGKGRAAKKTKEVVISPVLSSASSLPSLDSMESLESENPTLDELLDSLTLSELLSSVRSQLISRKLPSISVKDKQTVISCRSETPSPITVESKQESESPSPTTVDVVKQERDPSPEAISESPKTADQLPTMEEALKAAEQSAVIADLTVQLEIVTKENQILQNERATHSGRLLDLLDTRKQLMDANMKVAEMSATIQFLEENPIPPQAAPTAEVTNAHCKDCENHKEDYAYLENDLRKLKNAAAKYEQIIKEERTSKQELQQELEELQRSKNEEDRVATGRLSHSDRDKILNAENEVQALEHKLSEVKNKLKYTEEQREALITDVKGLKDKIQSDDRKLDDLTYSHSRELVAVRAAHSEELSKTESEISKLKVEMIAMKERAQIAEREAASPKRDLTEDLKIEIDSLRAQLSSSTSANDHLKTQLTEQQLRSSEQLVSLQSKLTTATTALSNAEAQLKLSTTSFSKEEWEQQAAKVNLQECEIQKLTTTLAGVQNELQNRNKEIENAPTASQLEEAKESLLKSEYDLRVIQRQLENKNTQCSEIQTELDRVTESRNDIQALKGQLEIENQSLKKTLNTVKANAASPADQELKKVIREKHDLTTTLNSVKVAHSGIESELSRMSLQKTDLENRLQSLNRQFLSKKSDCEAATRKASAMKADLDASHRRLTTLESENKRLQSNMHAPSTPSAKNESDVLAMNRKLRATLDTANRRIVSLESSSKELESSRNTLREEVAALKAKQPETDNKENDLLRTQLQAAQQRIVSINKENAEYRNEVKQDLATKLNTQANKIQCLNDQIAELEKSNASGQSKALVTQLDDIRMEHSRQSATLTAVRKENERLLHEIDKHKIEYEKVSQELRTLKIRSDLNEKYEEQLLARLANLEKERAEFAASKAVLRTTLSQSPQESNVLSLESELDPPLQQKVKRSSPEPLNEIDSPLDQFPTSSIKRRKSSITQSTPSQLPPQLPPPATPDSVRRELQEMRPTIWTPDEEQKLIGILKRRLKTSMANDTMSELFDHAGRQLGKEPDVVEKHFWANKEDILSIANIPGPSPRRPSHPYSASDDEHFRHVNQLLATLESDDEESTNLAQEVLSELTGRSHTSVIKRLDSHNSGRLSQQG